MAAEVVVQTVHYFFRNRMHFQQLHHQTVAGQPLDALALLASTASPSPFATKPPVPACADTVEHEPRLVALASTSWYLEVACQVELRTDSFAAAVAAAVVEAVAAELAAAVVDEQPIVAAVAAVVAAQAVGFECIERTDQVPAALEH